MKINKKKTEINPKRLKQIQKAKKSYFIRKFFNSQKTGRMFLKFIQIQSTKKKEIQKRNLKSPKLDQKNPN